MFFKTDSVLTNGDMSPHSQLEIRTIIKQDGPRALDCSPESSFMRRGYLLQNIPQHLSPSWVLVQS